MNRNIYIQVKHVKQMVETFIGVRKVDEETFRKFKAAMLRKKIHLGDALTKAMESYMELDEKQKKPLVKNLLGIRPIKLGKKVNWSEEIDQTLYGEK